MDMLLTLKNKYNRPDKSLLKQVGFTLVELLVTVAILGILVSIALPNYQEYVKKSRRAAAQSHLMDIAQQQQQYLLDARSYAADLSTLNVTTPTDVSDFYDIEVESSDGPPPSFTLTATPVAGSAQDGDVTLTIDNAGVKTPADKW